MPKLKIGKIESVLGNEDVNDKVTLYSPILEMSSCYLFSSFCQGIDTNKFLSVSFK